jgi:glucose-1-phosphate adenylyltransferase
MNKILGIINLSASTEKLKSLTEIRTVGSIPIAGRYRVIDFILSNMVNSGISNIAICTQGKSRSLYDHVGSGKYWDLDRKKEGLSYFHPETFNFERQFRTGDLETFKDMIGFVKSAKQPYVLITKSYMLAQIDYKKMLKNHEESDADITILYKRMNDYVRRFVDCDTLNIDEDNKVISVGKNLGKKKYYNVSMEMYMMKKEKFVEIIEEAIQRGDVDSLKAALLKQVNRSKVKAYSHEGYLACINSVQNFYRSNMDFLNPEIQSEMFSEDGLVYTKIKDEPSTFYGEDSYTNNSLISSGCIIEGVVENSVLSRGVHVKKGAIVRNSVVMQNSIIEETANINYMILDKNVQVSEKRVFNGDQDHPFVITKNTRV